MATKTTNADHTRLCSSIALLQERFRQLQRIKEMREERELVRMLAKVDQTTPTILGLGAHREQQPKWFLHPELLHPSRPICDPSSHFEPLHGFSEHQNYDTSLSIGLRANKPSNHASNNWREMDVDTSLHL